MFSQFRILSVVWAFEAIAISIYVLLTVCGISPHHALNGVATISTLVMVIAGLAKSNELEDKAHSKTGSPRLSLASDMMVWTGFGALLASVLATDITEMINNADYVRLVVEVLAIGFSIAFAGRAVNAEIVYVSRKYPPGVLYIPFFAIAIVLPAASALIPLWATLSCVVLQVLLVVVLTITPWSPISQKASS